MAGAAVPTDPPPAARARLEHLDWLRGVAVLLMIEAHLFDGWTADTDRQSGLYRGLMIVGGMGTALFLFLAGVAVALSAGSKWRRGGDATAAARAVAFRGLQIFGLAFLFRLQAWILGWSSDPRDLLHVDILNIMGPSIMVTALLWRAARTTSGRAVLFAAAAAIAALATPLTRMADFSALPDPIEAYLVPVPDLSGFVFFPWVALVFAGACAGVLIDAARTARQEQRLNIAFAAGGMGLAAAAFALSYLPSPVAVSDFWTTSPAYLAIRTGIMVAGIAAAFAWTRAFVPRGTRSPLSQLGRTSLFIYWIHVELIYGLISLPLHRSLSLRQACLAYLLFSAGMLACSRAKDRLLERYGRRPVVIPRPTQYKIGRAQSARKGTGD